MDTTVNISPTLKIVYDIITIEEAVTIARISTALNISRSVINTRLHRLKDCGLIDSTKVNNRLVYFCKGNIQAIEDSYKGNKRSVKSMVEAAKPQRDIIKNNTYNNRVKRKSNRPKVVSPVGKITPIPMLDNGKIDYANIKNLIPKYKNHA